MFREELEDRAELLLNHLKDQVPDEPVADETIDLAEELAEGVLQYWQETMSALRRRRTG